MTSCYIIHVTFHNPGENMKSIVTTIATLIAAAALVACGKAPEAAPAPAFEVPTVPAAPVASEPAKV
jgi:hypothetical protein